MASVLISIVGVFSFYLFFIFYCVGWVQTDMGNAGGRKAPVTVEDSCAGVLQLINTASVSATGTKTDGQFAELQVKLRSENCVFVDFTGKILPW